MSYVGDPKVYAKRKLFREQLGNLRENCWALRSSIEITKMDMAALVEVEVGMLKSLTFA